MTLVPNFLQKKDKIFKTTRTRLVLGLFLGITYAIVFYMLMYMTRESFRYFSITDYNEYWILSDLEIKFYNFFYALVSTIFGVSITFSFWFDRPNTKVVKNYRRRISIINDQRVLQWVFLSWFSKFSILYGFLFAFTFKRGFYTFSFYPNFIYLFILFIIVLYFQLWNTIRILDKKKSVNMMLKTFVLITIFAFALSNINIIDKSFFQNIQKQDISYSYNLNYPNSNLFNYQQKFRSEIDIYLVYSKDGDQNKPTIIVDQTETSLDNLEASIKRSETHKNKPLNRGLLYRLHINKNIKMKYVNELKDALSNFGVKSITYMVIPSRRIYNERYYKDYGITTPLLSSKTNYLRNYKSQNRIEIKTTSSEFYKVNNEYTKKKNITSSIRNYMQKNNYDTITLRIKENDTYSQYIEILSNSIQAINE